MRLTALLCFITAPCMAQDVYEWGAGSPPSQVRLYSNGCAAFACVTFDNTFVGSAFNPERGTVSLGGVTVQVIIDQGLSGVPDTMTVIPPEGLIAIPPSVTVEENASGTVMLFSADGAGA
jgi:hypothetical protein